MMYRRGERRRKKMSGANQNYITTFYSHLLVGLARESFWSKYCSKRLAGLDARLMVIWVGIFLIVQGSSNNSPPL